MADICKEEYGMKSFVLFLSLLLSACASHHKAVGEIGGAAVHRKEVAEPQANVRPRAAPIEKPQATRSTPENPTPKKREHNIEED
ncbi:MAG: hypothetical protein WC216_09495 [Gallionella sp.]|jgi:hypothetical protein